MNPKILGLDIAKNVFHIHGVDGRGRELYKKKLYREEVKEYFGTVKCCRVVLEACGGSNYWAREIEKFGHRVDLIAPQYVRPFVKRNKNDARDAESIAIAAQQPGMRYVPKKSTYQQDVQNLHRIRERLVKARTALVNEMRGLLGEYGIVIARGRQVFEAQFLGVMDRHEDALSELAKEAFYDLWDEYHQIEKRIKCYERKLQAFCRNTATCKRLEKVRGVGYLTATAVVAAIGNGSVFRNGREFAAWVGLTPREHSTGGKQRLLGISKRGDVYLRKLLVHGARVSLNYVGRYEDEVGKWANNLKQKKGTNRAAVALANKNARIIWAIIAKNEDYRTFPLAA